MTIVLSDQYIQLPSGNNSTDRPASPTSGSFRYQTVSNAPEIYNGTNWVTIGKRDGSSADNPALNGYNLKTDYSALTSGYYWIKSPLMPNALRMYVDMTEDGGGYDFYEITGGTSVSSFTSTHSGTALGLDLWMPRSKYHWRAAANFVKNILGKTGSAYLSYFNTTQVFKVYGQQTNYTSFVMRDPAYYGSGAPDWQVKDGGRWWLRDTVTVEPSGDYNQGYFLGGATSGYPIPEPYALTDIPFNDGTGQYATGSTYLVSTNAKP